MDKDFKNLLDKYGMEKNEDFQYKYKGYTLWVDKVDEVIYMRIEEYDGYIQELEYLEELIKSMQEDNEDVMLIVIEGIEEKVRWEWCCNTRIIEEGKLYMPRHVITIISRKDESQTHHVVKKTKVTFRDKDGLYKESKHKALISVNAEAVTLMFVPPFTYRRVNLEGHLSISFEDSCGGHKLEIPKLKCGHIKERQSIYVGRGEGFYVYVKGIEIFLTNVNNVKYDTGIYLKTHINHAAHIIQRCWRRTISNPSYKLCRKRLMQEYNEM